MPGSARTQRRPLPTKDFDTPQPFELLETFDQHDVYGAQLAEEHLQVGGFGRGGDARPPRVRRDDDFGGARQAVPVAVLAGHVELDVVVVRVLDGRDLKFRACSAGISRSISVVLPLPCRPTMATTRISASS